ncbi:putative Spore coat polysaccharide biosynthesis protein SpsF [Candidatus Propionivibrio aalborgensis]|uniref:Putative Spore coat polysaccharide biosynthesis protein SpsF n=2 Tax=Candidatus Propionivibrio aalborgensis TaxID=1860101 RepID=A0A1A8XZE5_9RHOO|nr:putative Spore coat polysaccharide biosynthesis protein SpsF [Candidatus Propionivibrio aalborgensis]
MQLVYLSQNDGWSRCEIEMKIVSVIQARMSSRRLPGKILRMVRGRSMLTYLTERLRHCRQLDGIVLATSREESDDPVVAFAETTGLPCYRGSLDDVASRLLGAADEAGAQALVRISGDSPLIDSTLVDRLVSVFRESDRPDLVTNVARRTFPKGQSIEVVSVEALRTRVLDGMSPTEKEHVTESFYKHPDGGRIISIEHTELLGDMQLSVDTAEDMSRLEALLDLLDEPYWRHGLAEIVAAQRRLDGGRA